MDHELQKENKKKKKKTNLLNSFTRVWIVALTGGVARAHTAPAVPKKKKGGGGWKKGKKEKAKALQHLRNVNSLWALRRAAPVTDLEPGWETHSRQPDMILWTGRWLAPRFALRDLGERSGAQVMRRGWSGETDGGGGVRGRDSEGLQRHARRSREEERKEVKLWKIQNRKKKKKYFTTSAFCVFFQYFFFFVVVAPVGRIKR